MKPLEAPRYTDRSGRPAYFSFDSYDLAIQTATLLGKPVEKIAALCLFTTWTVRSIASAWSGLDSISTARADTLLDSFDLSLVGSCGNRAANAVTIGRRLIQRIDSVPASSQLRYATAAVDLLRAHGENQECLELLPVFRKFLSDSTCHVFSEALTVSIARERWYQELALSAFAIVVAEAKEPKFGTQNLYLCGEMARRLGRWSQARTYYEQAENSEPVEPRLKELVLQQKQLVLNRLNVP